MEEKSVIDLTIDELVERHRLVRGELRLRFKKAKPVRMEPVSEDEMLYEYNTNGYEVFGEIANREGMDSAIEYRREMENLKQRRQK